ncbi:MAG: hypothetical protein AB7I48_23295 [Planctomycetaceae bacterium]
MPTPQKRQKPHEFTRVPEFDQAMRKLVEVPLDKVRAWEKAARKKKSKSRK